MRHLPLRSGFCPIILASIILISCVQRTDKHSTGLFGDSLYLKNVPAQPGEDTWKFIEDLKAPLWTKHDWKPTTPDSQHANLSRGIQLKAGFPDPDGRLETAYKDLRSFFVAGGISGDKGEYILETALSIFLSSGWKKWP